MINKDLEFRGCQSRQSLMNFTRQGNNRYFLSIPIIIIYYNLYNLYTMVVGKTKVQRWVKSHETRTADQRVQVLVL